MHRLKKTKNSTQANNYIRYIGLPETRIYQCSKCNRIMAVSNKGVNCSKRADGHHNHMYRCNSHSYIQRWEGHMAVCGYATSKSWQFYLWKL